MALKKPAAKAAAKTPPKKAPPVKKGGRVETAEFDYEGAARDFKTERGGARFDFGAREKVKIRVIPFFSEQDGRNKAYAVDACHFKLHPEHSRIACPGDDCPICAMSRDEAYDEETGKKLRVSKKYLFNVVDRDDAENRVQIYGAPKGVWTAIMDVILNRKDFPDALSTTKGLDFIITKKGSGLGTKYTVQVAPKPNKVDYVGKIQDLDALVAPRANAPDIDRLAEEIAATL